MSFAFVVAGPTDAFDGLQRVEESRTLEYASSSSSSSSLFQSHDRAFYRSTEAGSAIEQIVDADVPGAAWSCWDDNHFPIATAMIAAYVNYLGAAKKMGVGSCH